MTLLITDQPQVVGNVLIKALEKLIINRINDGAFTDQEEVTGRAYFSTLEGLDALFIPFVNLPKNIFWDSLKKKYPQLVDFIIDDINFILNFNIQNKPSDDQGIPYFVQRKGVKRSPYWTSECASFTLSVLTNFLMLRTKFGLPTSPDDAKVFSAINNNLSWVELCKRSDNGWSWTNDSPSHPWPTWSILDTFDEMINCDLLPEFKAEITAETQGILARIEHSFKEKDIPGTFLSAWEERVVNCQPYDVLTALDITRLMLAVSLLSNRNKTKPLANTLFNWAGKTDFSNIDYRYHFPIKSDYIYDSSLVPCVFRTLVIMAGVLSPKLINKLDEHIGQNHKIVVNRVYNILMKSLINHEKYKDLWGVKNGDLTYELYYTERTIEALTEFLMHYGDTAKVILEQKEIDSESKDDIMVLSATKFVKEHAEVAIVELVKHADLPVLGDLTQKVKNEKGQDIFNNFIIVFVLHFLNDLPPFIENFHKLGMLYEDMYFLVKTYNYPGKNKLVGHIQKLGGHVYLPDNPLETAFYLNVNEILTIAIKKAESNKKKIMIIEDGGYFAPTFHKPEFVNSILACSGAVEQTTKGHRRDELIKNTQFPIISIARSNLKRIIEAPEVASKLVDNIIFILNNHIKRPPFKTNALVLGAGTIGKNLAKELVNKKINVSIYDIDYFKRIECEIDKYNVLQNMDNLSDFHIIIGTSGETSLKDFYNLKHNVILVSGSSERVEFDINTLEAISISWETKDIITSYTLEKENKIVRLVLDGEPINFALSGGISDSIIDPIYSEMFLAAIEIAKNSNLKAMVMDIPTEIEKSVYEAFKNYYLT